MTPRHGRAVAAHVLPPTAAVLVVLAAWWAVTAWTPLPAYLLPSPGAVITALVENWRTVLWPATAVTGVETLFGLGVGVIAAFLIALVVHTVTPLRRAIEPLLVATQTVPVAVLAPLLTIALGYGIAPKVVVVALLTFFPVTVSLLAGMEGVDPAVIATMRTLWARPAAILWRVRLPAALPQAFAGLRIAVTFAPVSAVFGEYAGASEGLGYHMIQAIPRLRTDVVLAEVVILTAMTALLYLLVAWLEHVACPWRPRGR